MATVTPFLAWDDCAAKTDAGGSTVPPTSTVVTEAPAPRLGASPHLEEQLSCQPYSVTTRVLLLFLPPSLLTLTRPRFIF